MKLLVCAKTVLAPANKQSTMNSAPTKCRRAAFPLPLGEGQGEGAQLREKGKKNVGVVPVLAKPSPQPSPKGNYIVDSPRERVDDSRYSDWTAKRRSSSSSVYQSSTYFREWMASAPVPDCEPLRFEKILSNPYSEFGAN